MRALQNLRLMDDRHLLLALRAEIYPLTTTDKEIALLDRFEALLDEMQSEAYRTYAAIVEDYGLDPDNLRTLCDAMVLSAGNTADLLKAVGDAGYDNPAELKSALELSDALRALACDGLPDAIGAFGLTVESAETHALLQRFSQLLTDAAV